MSISGNLEDVSVAEVMQFIHLGRRSGTLSLSADDRRAEVGFHRGKIVSAWAPGSQRLGDLLLGRGLIGETTLVTALRIQEHEDPRRSLGQILVSNAVVSPESMRRAVVEQIEQTIFELVTWTRGTFQFALDDLHPVDDIAMYPDEVVPDLDLNTQMLLLEATRIFDERNRDGDDTQPAPNLPPVGGRARGEQAPTGGVRPPPVSRPEGGPSSGSFAQLLDSTEPKAHPSDAARQLAHEGDAEIDFADISARAAAAAVDLPTRVQVVTADASLATALSLSLGEHHFQTALADLVEAGHTSPGEPPPIIVLDLRGRHVNLAELQTLRKLNPRAALVTVVDAELPPARAYAAGALAALPADPDAISACIENLRANRLTHAEPAANPTDRAGFARLRRVVTDIRSGLLSATMALNLMNIVSESVERAVLFLVRRDELLALGAFGFANDGTALAELTRGLKLRLGGDDAFTAAVAGGRTAAMDFGEANLPSGFAAMVGRPRSGQMVLFPVLGSERVISVIYADNGTSKRPIEELEILELATAQVGIAFENELLRRQLAKGKGA